jgi:hypothetical protein
MEQSMMMSQMLPEDLLTSSDLQRLARDLTANTALHDA